MFVPEAASSEVSSWSSPQRRTVTYVVPVGQTATSNFSVPPQ